MNIKTCQPIATRLIDATGIGATYRRTTVFRSEPAYQDLHQRRRLPGEAVALYAKNEKADLTARDKKALTVNLKEITGAMAKKVKSRLADDLWAGLDELRDFVAGKKTGAVVHRVSPSQSDARDARHKLGLNEPKAVRRAIAKRNSAA